MGKYIFNKDYETQIRVASNTGIGTGTRQVKIAKGVIVDGESISTGLTSIKYGGLDLNIDSSYLDPTNSGIVPPSIAIKNNNQGTVAVKTNDNPKGSTKKVSASIFTTKNVVIGLFLIGGTIYFLKHKNII